MAKVDPFLIPVPRKFLDDPDLSPFFIYLQRWAHDMWARTGSGDDAIAELQTDTQPIKRNNRVEQLNTDLVGLTLATLPRHTQTCIKDKLQALELLLLSKNRKIDKLYAELQQLELSLSNKNNRIANLEKKLDELEARVLM